MLHRSQEATRVEDLQHDGDLERAHLEGVLGVAQSMGQATSVRASGALGALARCHSRDVACCIQVALSMPSLLGLGHSMFRQLISTCVALLGIFLQQDGAVGALG